MNCITPCDAHKYAQGKGCECDRFASRAALGLDEPITTPEEAEAWTLGIAVVGWLAVFALCFAFFYIVLIQPKP